MTIAEALKIDLEPIGTFRSQETERYALPRQAGLVPDKVGVVELCPHQNYEQALEGLEGFERVWLVTYLHRNQGHWRPKVMPPRGGVKRGVFSTRSPHRPNPIGLSCVKVLEVKGRILRVSGHDILDGTPILDIKPYIDYADAHKSSRQGWLEDCPDEVGFKLTWSDLAGAQADFLTSEWGIRLREDVEYRLETNPFPYPNNRICRVAEEDGTELYQLGYKTWRILYELSKDEKWIRVLEVRSGYTRDFLFGLKKSKWDDIPVHFAFKQRFGSLT